MRIATTRARDLQPLAAAGQSGTEAWETLHALLERELSPAHAALLAEPVVNDAQDTVDWYADASDAAVVRLQELPPPVREQAQAVLDRLVGDVQALGARLGASRADADRFLADILGLALRLPGPDYVYVCGEQPVLVAWAHVPSGGRGGDVRLFGRAVAPAAGHAAILPPPPPPSAYATAPAARPWLWGAVGAALLASVMALYLVSWDPFAWLTAGGPPQCRLEPAQLGLEQGLQDAVARETVLRAELSQLTVAAGRRRLMCPPQPPTQAALSPPGEDAQRAERRGAQQGKLQIILAWDDTNDLDLRVICPDGSDVNFIRRHACGGMLDVDANGDGGHLTPSPVENVYFDEPLPGRYLVVVDPYSMRQRPATPFRLTIRRSGQPDQVIAGTAQGGQRGPTVTEFTVGPAP